MLHENIAVKFLTVCAIICIIGHVFDNCLL